MGLHRRGFTALLGLPQLSLQFDRLGRELASFHGHRAAALLDLAQLRLQFDGLGRELVGLRRRGFDAAQLANIKSAYKVLYREGLKLGEATEELKRRAAEQPEIAPLVAFLPRVTRSLIR